MQGIGDNQRNYGQMLLVFCDVVPRAYYLVDRAGFRTLGIVQPLPSKLFCD